MVSDKGKDTISSSNLSCKCNDVAKTSQSETTASSLMEMNVKGTGVAYESKNEEENASKEAMNEEKAIVVIKNGKIAIEQQKNEETGMEEEEKHEENIMEEDDKDESNALEEDNDVENAAEEEDEAREEEEEEEKEEENEEKAIELAKSEEKIGSNSKEKVKRSRKRGRTKKVARSGSETVAAKLEDKPGSSSQKKVSKRADSMGMIFMCSSKTKKDCYHYKVLGLPASKRDTVEKVYKGMRLFLFDFDLRLMYGIYKAAGPGGYNIEPKAFKSAFPSQVRFTVLEDCLPLAEEKFKTVLKDNYYTRNKFDCQLTSEQVKNLCKLFVATSRGSKSKKLGRNRRAETHSYVGRDSIRRQRLDEERRSALGADRRYHERPIMYERESFSSTVAPRAGLPPLPLPPAPASSYPSYGRPLEVDVYRRDALVDRRDYRLLDLDPRQNEFGSRDPYISYMEPPPYRDPLYSAGLPPEYKPHAGLLAEYHPLAGPRSDHRHPAAAPSEYGPLRPLYRY